VEPYRAGSRTGVNISGDGRIIVAAFLDGSIRWHRWSDGKELLRCSSTANPRLDRLDTDRLLHGLARRRGSDRLASQSRLGPAGRLFPASRFRERFNRPDIVHLALETLDEDVAIKQANAASNRQEDTRPLTAHLPPIIRIVEPANGAHVSSGR